MDEGMDCVNSIAWREAVFLEYISYFTLVFQIHFDTSTLKYISEILCSTLLKSTFNATQCVQWVNYMQAERVMSERIMMEVVRGCVGVMSEWIMYSDV